ncbi:hypothetical protein AB0B04_18815 [Streptomyces xinghaiensis]|uniref:Uncharacterized protein n=2 Tax=Streptomyces TaxID=1883 RepID=A0A3R7F824_9ACTN|nr:MULTISPECIES: hypothetical protein [Streptomyces]KNE81396.1 hypothetical protein ADZ36_16580 [Streptomyces fradiae]OFA48265.1 hypothetical protein BEN35_19185 [Streptomyces fradiae]PQM20666.1 hypothetical protein Sfr7A_26130 [Streptomyces xinghaiensis]RKM92606.1 hypothetical protein SFRA_024785 [Streptomyces xinghaiensis]RNC70574.1 hypothetical protein DC095_025775 [Streptomyces xinghaiensis]
MATTSHTTTGTGTGTDLLWQNLADALNALIAAGQFPDFHDLYGTRNDWRHQPYATAHSHADAPWVVFDLSTRQFTVSSRERTVSGEHSGGTRRKRR